MLIFIIFIIIIIKFEEVEEEEEVMVIELLEIKFKYVALVINFFNLKIQKNLLIFT